MKLFQKYIFDSQITIFLLFFSLILNAQNISQLHVSQNKYQLCIDNHSDRRFYSQKESNRNPPLLYTIPGSGNTWVRLLIEYAAGIYTGSMYQSSILSEILPAEEVCNKSVILIKAHPILNRFRDLNAGIIESIGDICNKSNMTKFERAVILIRNPFDSIWAEYQRSTTGTHSGGIPKSMFNWTDWNIASSVLSYDYFDSFNEQYTAMESIYGSENFVFIRYEYLKNESTRLEELNILLKFLNINVSTERLKCAFLLAKNDKVLRKINNDDMTKELAYTVPLVCSMWSYFGKIAKQQNFQIFGNIDCDDQEAYYNRIIPALSNQQWHWVRVLNDEVLRKIKQANSIIVHDGESDDFEIIHDLVLAKQEFDNMRRNRGHEYSNGEEDLVKDITSTTGSFSDTFNQIQLSECHDDSGYCEEFTDGDTEISSLWMI